MVAEMIFACNLTYLLVYDKMKIIKVFEQLSIRLEVVKMAILLTCFYARGIAAVSLLLAGMSYFEPLASASPHHIVEIWRGVCFMSAGMATLILTLFIGIREFREYLEKREEKK